MPHVSKKVVDTRTKNDLDDKLFSVLLQTPGNERKRLFKELYTPTERLMFAKRIGMIALIERSVPARTIGKILGVSTSTVIRFQTQIERGGLKGMRKRIKQIATQNWIAKFLEDIGVMPFGKKPKSLTQLLDEL